MDAILSGPWIQALLRGMRFPAWGAACALIAVGAAFAQEYAYDVHGRLSTVSYADGTVVTFCYDDAGNRTRRAVSTAAVTCSSGNGAPVAQNDFNMTLTSYQVCTDVRANDSDPDNDPLTVTAVSPASPSGSPVIVAGDICFGAGQAGLYTFTYTVSDPAGATDTATVTVHVIEDCGGIMCL